MPIPTPAASSLLRQTRTLQPTAAGLCHFLRHSATAGIQSRSFGIKTTLKVQEHISKIIRADKDSSKAKEAKDEVDMQLSGPKPRTDPILTTMPPELRVPLFPEPIRAETMDHKWSSKELEALDIGTTKHRIPDLISERIALWAVRNA
ncbi:hypothetical protein GGI12_004512, partial [Dipsacomyces acuminosporus]